MELHTNRLSQCTFPKALTDTPAYHNWPGENLGVVYGEGLYIGYRHYERANIAPLFPFGHGLSYTTFEYGRPSLSGRVLSENGPALELLVAVSNIGEADGFETVQIYVRDEKSRLPRPEKELVSFEKVFLERDQTRHLRIRIDKYAVGYYDTSLRAWIAEEGRFEVLIGASSADIRLVFSCGACSPAMTHPLTLFLLQTENIVRSQGVLHLGLLGGFHLNLHKLPRLARDTLRYIPYRNS